MSATTAPTEVVLRRRQLYMLPTRYGLLFSLLLLVQLLAAVNYGNGLAYALTFLLGSLAVVSMFYTHRNLLRLRLTYGACTPVFAGELATFVVHLMNDAPTPRFGVAVTYAKNEIARVDIPARASVGVEVPVPTVKRGELAAPAITITTRFPLGLLYSWSRRVELKRVCLVYPRPADPTPLRTSQTEALDSAQGLTTGGDDFIGTREFRPGDSPHHVDWKAVARGQGWQIKQFGSGHQATVWFDWDTLEGLATEDRLRVLTLWILEAEKGEMLYGLRLPEKTFQPANGAHHRHKCLRALALFGLNEES